MFITSLIAAIFMFGLRDTVSHLVQCPKRFSDCASKVRANPKPWFLLAMLLFIPIFGIIFAMACCNVKVKVENVKEHL